MKSDKKRYVCEFPDGSMVDLDRPPEIENGTAKIRYTCSGVPQILWVRSDLVRQK